MISAAWLVIFNIDQYLISTIISIVSFVQHFSSKAKIISFLRNNSNERFSLQRELPPSVPARVVNIFLY